MCFAGEVWGYLDLKNHGQRKPLLVTERKEVRAEPMAMASLAQALERYQRALAGNAGGITLKGKESHPMKLNRAESGISLRVNSYTAILGNSGGWYYPSKPCRATGEYLRPGFRN